MSNFNEQSARATASLEQLVRFVQRHPGLLLLTGAGISTGSGIPDYRDQEGVRRGKPPVQGPEFRASEAVRRRYWARSMVGWPQLARTEPNAGHHAIAALEADGRLSAVLTQNVDGLHQRAGSVRLLELHGNIHTVACLGCAQRYPRCVVQSMLERDNPQLAGASADPAPDGDALLEPSTLADFHLPVCPHCAGMLTPAVVFFGDGVARATTEAAEQRLAEADAVLVVGSSLVVFSGYRFCKLAADSGKPVAALNLGKMRADPLLTLKVELPSEQALPALVNLLRAG